MVIIFTHIIYGDYSSWSDELQTLFIISVISWFICINKSEVELSTLSFIYQLFCKINFNFIYMNLGSCYLATSSTHAVKIFVFK